MKIHLVRTKLFPAAELKKVYELLLPHEGIMEFILESSPILFEEEDYDWEPFFDEMQKYREKELVPDEDFLICITELDNYQSWFSAFDLSGKNNIFVQGEDWENFIYAEKQYPITFEIIANILQKILFGDFFDMLNHHLIHEEPIGCINDFCKFKPEIDFKMRTADICRDCLQALEDKLGDTKLLKQSIDILENLRREMVHSRVFLKPLSFEEKLPFTVAITKRKMGMTSQPFRKFLMMIDHFDCLVRTSVVMLSNLYSERKADVEIFFADNNLTEKPALGTWVSALQRLSAMKVEVESISLPQDFNKKLSGIITLANEQKIIAIRNEKRGHGYIECSDEGYEDDFLRNLPVLEEIEKHLSPLFYRFHYCQILNTDHLGKGKFKISYIDLSGSNPAFNEDITEVVFDDIDDVPTKNQCYLVTPKKDKWISLDPYLKFGTCPECKHMRLLIQDGEVYLDPLIGHRVDLKKRS